MGILSLFGKKAPSKKKTGKKNSKNSKKVCTEKDNKGTRVDTKPMVTKFWIERNSKTKKKPLLLYKFRDEDDAIKALLELPYIKETNDSTLISTEKIYFGVYKADDGQFDLLLCGDFLDQKLWQEAREIFANNNGQRSNEHAPER